MCSERRGIERHGHDLLLRAKLDQRLAEKIERAAVARIVQIVAVDADAIDADAIRKILDRARAQQVSDRGLLPDAFPVGGAESPSDLAHQVGHSLEFHAPGPYQGAKRCALDVFHRQKRPPLFRFSRI